MKERTLHTYFAADVEHPGGIMFDTPQPLFHTDIQREHLYDLEAERIAKGLFVNLPQGVFERVLRDMAGLMVTNYQTVREGE